ncbi:MAG: filamentous hemagglutinin N-terminal domain-containing protein [Pleurocapsa sp. MO_192.B19]|nr:filamentous hemagglutinin N-terminal domain-containing protein [Pleurocapsa sp. MO_192.B19]
MFNCVTGSNPSNILGILGVLGNANLFLINPKGIIFGTNAQLDLGGSFVASTADSIVFDNDFEFSASDPQAPPLLTINIPLGLQFGKTPGTIINRSKGEGLQVQPGKTIALVGGDVLMESGIIFAPGAKIELGSVTDESLIHLTPIAFGWDLDYEGVENFQNIQLSEGAFAQTRGESGGDIQLSGKRIAIISGSGIVTGNQGVNPGGSITVTTSESLELDNGELTSGSSFGATGVAGDITVMTRQLTVTNSSFIDASSLGAGQGGNVIVNATESVEVNGEGKLTQLTTQAFGTGNAGNLKVTTERLILRDGGQITSSTFSSGNGGNVSVDASEYVEVIGSGSLFDGRDIKSGLFAQTNSSFPIDNGNGGNLSINTGSLSIQDGGTISVAADEGSTGRAGNLEIDANSLFLNQGTITAETAQSAGEEGANITLEISDLLRIENESQISATASGLADGGNIDIDAGFVIAFPNQNNDIIARAAQGNGGNIDIATNAIFGIAERSSTPVNNTNDIDPSSEFGLDGTVNINELEVNPAETLEELPVEIIDVTGLVEETLCQQARGSEFIVTGKGGIAPSPTQTRDGEISEVNLVEPATFEEDGEVVGAQALRPAEEEIIEAQGWIINARGMVELVAHKTDVNGSPAQPKNAKTCNANITTETK